MSPIYQIVSPQIVPFDFAEYARYFLKSKVPSLGGPDRSTDFDDSGLDWTASANAGFPGVDSGGTIVLFTVFLAGTIGFAYTKTPVNNQGYLRSMVNEPWGAGARSRNNNATNIRAGFVSLIRLGGSNTLTLGVDTSVSTDFLTCWTTNLNALSNIVPVITTIPYLGVGKYHECYMTYNGNVVDLWGGGDFRRGIEPFKGGEYSEFSTVPNQSAQMGVTVQSINGTDAVQMQCATSVGKVSLFV
jgi:hypothetical protein